MTSLTFRQEMPNHSYLCGHLLTLSIVENRHCRSPEMRNDSVSFLSLSLEAFEVDFEHYDVD